MASSGNPNNQSNVNDSSKKSQSQISLHSSGSASSTNTTVSNSIMTLMKREKRAVAVYLKEESSKSNNTKPLNDHLDTILDPNKPIDDFESIDFCKWIIAGGLTFEDFAKKVREYDSSVMCGLVWTANFVAYRCRTCGISPCMSICSDCFQAGNHEGHDFNMFRSQAGGACDCGDSSVMRPEGFCPRHGEHRENKSDPEAPAELMAVAKEMVPRLFIRLLYHLREQFLSQVRTSRNSYHLNINDLEHFLNFMQSLSDMGAAMRRVMAQALINPSHYAKSTVRSDQVSEGKVDNYTAFKEILNGNGLRYPLHFDKYKDKPGMSQKLDYSTIIEELVFWVMRYEFPQRLVTFLLGLLPDDLYKEAFAKAFVKHYSRISVVLSDAQDRSTVANRIVHISVQLFSNENLAVHLTENHNLLLIIILSLASMIQSIKIVSSLEDPDLKSRFHCVVNCEHEIMKDHCYWPVVSDLINVLSHRKIAHVFLGDSELVNLWLDLLNDMQGMNLNTRELSQHVEYEPDTYYAAFSAELEISASPMWSLLMHCQTPDTRHYVLDMIKSATVALQDWFEAINFKEAMKPNPYQLTFHIPLHRYLATFIMTAVKYHDVDLDSILPDEVTLKKIMMHPLQIQVCMAQIYAGMWVRNGIQIKGQAMTYIQCHFCYSMADADLYLLQLCATKLDPDSFITTVLDRFHILNWMSYSPEPTHIGILMEPEQELSMVEGALSLFSALMGIHTYLGISEEDLIRKEMASLLCMNDRQHSTLMDLMPERTGVSGLAKELFEPTLQKLAEYKAPNFEAGGGLQQGTYVPKAEVWEKDFDPVHVSQRAIYRRDMQSAMDRYTEYLRTHKGYKRKTTPWPPFKIEDNMHHSYAGIYRLLNCKSMHAFLFTVLHKALTRDKNLPEAILFHAVHLLELCLHFAPKTFPNRIPGLSLQVQDGQLDKWYGTSDIKANACDIISEVIVPIPVTEEEIRASGITADDMDTSTLEEMFQLQPSVVSSSTGPITSAQLGQMPSLAMVSLPALDSFLPHPPPASTKPATKRFESRGVATAQFVSKKITVKESLISVLIKLHTKTGGVASYKPKTQSPSNVNTILEGGDAQLYIARFLDRLYTASTAASRVIDETCRALNMTKVKAGPSETEKDSKRRKAWNRQQKLMAEFASKQKAFMEQAMEEETEKQEPSSASASSEQEESLPSKLYDCVICNQSTPSTGEKPIGLVVFLQASSVLGHRQQSNQEHVLSMSDSQVQWHRKTSCGKVNKKKLEILQKNFEGKSCEVSVNIGWEGGVVAQTCGHYLHLDCHKSYLDSLRNQNHAEVLAVNKREYWCPLCRQLSNSVIPMVPDESMTMLVKPLPKDEKEMVADIAEMMIKRRITRDHAMNRAMGTVMEDLTNITYPNYRAFSATRNPESVLLFICSVARINLEVELLQMGGKLNDIQPPTKTKNQNCFLPLVHVLSLHSKVLISTPLYPDLWAHLTGRNFWDEASCSVSVYEKQVPMLIKDPLSLFIQFVLTMSFTIEAEHLDFIIQMLYNLVYVQALAYLSCKFSSDERDAWRKKGRQNQSNTLEGLLSLVISGLSRSSLYEEIDSSHTLPAICQSVWSPQSVEQVIQEYCLPFLRISALMKLHLFSIELPSPESGQDEFQLLSRFLNLGLPTPPVTEVASLSTANVHWVVEEPHVLIRAWCLHIAEFANNASQDAKSLLTMNPSWQKPSLIKLPNCYYQIFQVFRSAKCNECSRVPKDPALCLVCGQFLCFREQCCAQNNVHESVGHSIACGAGTSMFLLVNSSLVVVVRGQRATLWGSVYLDEHGEEDRDLKRGKPLYLSMARYNLLENQWLSHSFDHSCKRWIWHRDQL
uniref:E3 ubiquitin-protein ligase n=1 Tax=Biomphalaria glabrata TaxID=6526 RepID=A0A2C9KCF7_BIOGL